MQWAAFEDQYGIYLVSEYASKGDVFADVEKRGGQMSEAEAVRQVLHPFLLALIYLHELNIMHRDIKPENLLFTGTGALKVAGVKGGGWGKERGRRRLGAGGLGIREALYLKHTTKLMGLGFLRHTDFGLSINFESERPVTRVGTLDYMVRDSGE